MNRKPDISAALAAADNPVWLDSTAQVARAAKAWRRSGVLGLDTEFVRERTYHANLGLVQVSDGQTVWLLDPLADGALAPLRELLDDRRILKVVHSPSEDLEVLLHVTGSAPEPLFDTQMACALLGEPLQLGYHVAVEKLFGIPVDKGLTRSNWMARPLRPALLHYAALDVCLLPHMQGELAARLSKAERTAWLEEDCARLLEAARNPTTPSAAWQRIRGIERLDGASLAVLKALAAWREKEARKRNRPRGFIVSDPLLVAMARSKPRKMKQLEALAEWHPRARQRFGEAVIGVIEHVVGAGKTLPELPQPSRADKRRIDQLRACISEIAAGLGVEPALLATRRELEQIVLTEPGTDLPERLRGWRHALLEQVLSAT